MPLEITESKTDSVILLTLRGTLVMGRDTELLTEKVLGLLDAGETQILLDLGQVSFIDSTGISALIRAYSSAMTRGAAVKLLRLTRRVYDVLQITRLSSVFEIYNELEKAVASFRKPSANTGGDKPRS